MQTYTAAPDIEILTTPFPIPGFGSIPINAFVLKGSEPVLVDTGPVVHADDFMAALRTVIDPGELRWIWLTHTDLDHIGCLHRLLGENPELKVITTFLGVGIMSLADPLPMDRVHLVNPGQTITVGDRSLTAFKPPVFDNPSTTGFFDDRSGILFSADCFGAILDEVPSTAAEIPPEALAQGQVFWATVDSPWLHKADGDVLAAELETIRSMAPKMILSSHLPPAGAEMTDRLLRSIAQAPGADPFVGPDQAALEQMLAAMTGDGHPTG